MSEFDRTIASRIIALEREIEALRNISFTKWRGTQAGDFTTTTLPRHGDYGYQTTDNEVQMNIGGTIRAISTAAL